MGLFKKSDKSDAGEDESNRRALFGRSKNKSPQENSNPYAQPIPTDPYTKAKQGIGMAPPPPGGLNNNGPSPGPGPHNIPSDNKYGGYTPNSYGNQSGYGGDRYGSGGAGAGTTSRYGAGGYGGLGSTDPNDATGDADRNALFGGAKNRQQQQGGAPGNAPPPYSPGQGDQPAYGGGSNEYSMAKFDERQLTAEEQEEESIQAVKQEMRHVKQGDISSTRNALRVAAQAEETGRQTLARLGAQGEMIHDAESNLDSTKLQGHMAEDKARELTSLNNRPFFVPYMSNPFTSNSRKVEQERKDLEKNQSRRALLEGTRGEAYRANSQLQRDFRDLDRQANSNKAPKKASVTERAKYQFEADSEDEGMEDEIEQNLDLLSGAAGRLNGLAKATGRELEEQNRHLERITGKVRISCPLKCSFYFMTIYANNCVTERLCRRSNCHESC